MPNKILVFNPPGGGGGGITNSAGANVVTKSDGTNLVASSITDNGTTVATTEPIVQTSASASALVTGPNGATNPVLKVDNSTASQADGVSITGGAVGAGTTFTALSSGSNSPITVATKGTGGVVLKPLGSPTTYFDVQDSGGNSYLTVGADVTFRNMLNGFGAGNDFTVGGSTGRIIVGNGGSLEFRASSGGGVDTQITRARAGVARVGGSSADASGALLLSRVVTAKTADYPVVAADSNTFFTNTGAGAGVTFTLPTPVVGMTYEFYRDANQTVTIDVAGSVTVRVGASVTTAGGNLTLDAVGSRIRVVCISTTQWVGDLSGAASFN